MHWLAPLIFRGSPKFGATIFGANENPEVKKHAAYLFDSIEKRNLSLFSNSIHALIGLYANVMELRSSRNFNLVQELAAYRKDELNEYINWPDLISYGPNGPFYERSEAKARNIDFMRQAQDKINQDVKPTVTDYLDADDYRTSAFMLLAATNENLSGVLLESLIDSATPEQLAQMQQLAPQALMASVAEGSGKSVEVLIQKFRINPNQPLENGNTILHIACEQGCKDQYEIERDHADVIQALLENGADPTLRNNEGKIPGESLDFWYLTRVPRLLSNYRGEPRPQNRH